MSLIRVTDWPSPEAAVLFEAGRAMVKAAEEVAYNLYGTLQLSNSGWLILSVPNPLVRGVFAAMKEPGAELPTAAGGFNAHISVMSPEDVALAGGPDAITERGKQFAYTLGRVYAAEPADWPGVSKVWYVRVHSPELQAVRRSYGLSGLPRDGKYDFHVTVAVRKRGVLARNGTAKGPGSQP